MTSMTVKLRSIEGTQAAAGWAGPHTVMVDRPDGLAGGHGLGFNGGQLLALAIGGCLCNDLHYVAHDMGIGLSSVAVDVTVTFEGDPMLATDATASVSVRSSAGPREVDALIARAADRSTVANSLIRGLPVRVKRTHAAQARAVEAG